MQLWSAKAWLTLSRLCRSPLEGGRGVCSLDLFNAFAKTLERSLHIAPDIRLHESNHADPTRLQPLLPISIFLQLAIVAPAIDLYGQ